MEIRSQPIPGATAQGKANCGQRFVESNCLSAIWRYNFWQTLTEDALPTLVVIAKEFPCLKFQLDGDLSPRQIGYNSLISAVDAG
jgi:hypothetical protein